MKAIFLSIILILTFGLSAQIDFSKLSGYWCVVEVTNAQDAEEMVTEDELLDLFNELSSSVFYFASENRFTIVEGDMTFEEALEDSLVYTYSKEDQTLIMRDSDTDEIIRFYLVKVAQDELIFRFYDDVFGFELRLKRCR